LLISAIATLAPDIYGSDLQNSEAHFTSSILQGQSAFRPHDDIYHDNIKTVRLFRVGHESSEPIINFNSGEQLQLTFDDLDGDLKTYKYTVVHFDAFWNISDLWPGDYISGFTDDLIEDYRFSLNTVQPYTHYTLLFPNPRFSFTLPGNYLLLVFLKDDPGNIAFTRRFSVVDPKVNIEGRIRMPPTSSERTKKHEVGFTINTQNFRITDHRRNLKVLVRQNNRWDNEIKPQPHQIRGDLLDYNYPDETITFYAVNEFRSVDLRSVRHTGKGVQLIERDSEGYHLHLWPEQRRTFNAYIHETDLNGSFQVLAQNIPDPDIGSEYLFVNFTLQMENPVPNADVFITGKLSDWQFRDDNRMQYCFNRKAYVAELYLKQGFYNYHYSLLVKGERSGDTGFFEGNHADTGNEYTVYVYYRQPGTRYDALIGVRTFNSKDFL